MTYEEWEEGIHPVEFPSYPHAAARLAFDARQLEIDSIIKQRDGILECAKEMREILMASPLHQGDKYISIGMKVNKMIRACIEASPDTVKGEK